MYVSVEQLNSRLNSQKERIETNEVKRVKSKHTQPILTTEEKELVGALAITHGQKAVAETFGIDKPKVSRIERGVEGTPGNLTFNPDLKKRIDEHVTETKAASSKKAVDVLMTTLGVVEKLAPNMMKATDASKVARDMSAVLRDLTVSKDGGDGPKVSIVINAPGQRSERTYETVEA